MEVAPLDVDVGWARGEVYLLLKKVVQKSRESRSPRAEAEVYYLMNLVCGMLGAATAARIEAGEAPAAAWATVLAECKLIGDVGIKFVGPGEAQSFDA